MHTETAITLFIFAHQDDEYFAAPWIKDELSDGSRVACVYLTDGGTRTSPAARDSESRRVLESLGVRSEDIAFLGNDDRIADGSLVYNLLRARKLLHEWFAFRHDAVRRIYSPDYEGGHADHDAAYVLAVALARDLDMQDGAWSFALYNAHGCPTPFFRALNILKHAGARTLRYSLRSGLEFAMLCWNYPSQLRTWLGLFPESFLRRVFLRAEFVNPLDPMRLKYRPHAGALLYERMFGVDYSDFSAAARAFMERDA